MTKEELISQLTELSKTEDILSVRNTIRDVVENYNAITTTERKAQQTTWDEAEHEEGDDFAFTPNPLDEQFDAIYAEYKETAKAQREKIAEEQRKNLDAKQGLLAELRTLIAEEEHIGKAFGTMKEISERWDSLGNVPGNNYRETMDAYQRLREEFYYNIRIYKELQENDLQKNEIIKKGLIEKATDLTKLEDIKEIEVLARGYQKQWFDVGPSPREVYQQQGDDFFAALRLAFDKVQVHYDAVKAEMDKHLEAKKALVEKVKSVNHLEITQHGTWLKKTDEVIALQAEWKTIGNAKRSDNETIWQTFRGECDTFFNNKSKYYADRNAGLKVNQTAKEELIEKAKALQSSEDWKKTTEALIGLQQKWKTVGSAPQRVEQKLWQQFRSSCDVFFNKKKEHFSSKDEEYEANLKEKLILIDEVKATALTGNRQEDLAMLKAVSERWNSIGFVPRKNKDAVYKAYNTVLDERYNTLNVQRQESNMSNYKSRVSKLKGEKGEGSLKREKTILREKIDRLKSRVLQYENNMNFFSGKGAEGMRKEVQRNIDKAQREIDDIKSKLSLLAD